MIAMVIVFFLFLFTFGCIGSMRGWAKELLVIFSVIVGLALISVLENLLPVIGPFLKSNPMIEFWERTLIILGMTLFGYQSPKFSRIGKSVEKRDRIGDFLLGIVVGIMSGYFVVGTLWSIWNAANYPLAGDYISAPPASIADTTQRILNILPPVWLGKAPNIYIAVVLSFVFVIVVFI